jgi:hypothetical protein
MQSTFATIVTAAIAIAPICAQSPKLLQITSPASGVNVRPGETVKVTVASPANVRFESVALGSPNVNEMISGVASSVPAEFSLQGPTRRFSSRSSTSQETRDTGILNWWPAANRGTRMYWPLFRTAASWK